MRWNKTMERGKGVSTLEFRLPRLRAGRFNLWAEVDGAGDHFAGRGKIGKKKRSVAAAEEYVIGLNRIERSLGGYMLQIGNCVISILLKSTT